jgi:hypothetical protein
VNCQRGQKIPPETLQQIDDEFSIPNDGVLKNHCEGSEHESVNFVQDYILKKFTQIHIEYHFGKRISNPSSEDPVSRLLYED